jgi:peptidyl-prolyl cis-trans isomerase C
VTNAPKPLRRPLFVGLSTALLATILAVASPVLAQDATTPAAPTAPAPAAPAPAPAAPAEPDPNTVIATVGGEAITEAELGFAAEDLTDQLANVPPEQRRPFLVTVLIEMKLMAQAARQEGMDQTDTFRQRLDYLGDRALRRDYFAEKIGSAVTAEAVQAAYEQFKTSLAPEEEIRAKHILVTTEAEAKTIKAAIDGGARFEEQAVAHSLDGSADAGGDLGFFTRGMMVQPFEQAAFALQVGQVSDPVQSQFGWHLIKLEERRQAVAPSLQEKLPELQQQIMFGAYDTVVGALRQNAEIVVNDPALVAVIGPDGAGPPAAEPAAPAETPAPTPETAPAPVPEATPAPAPEAAPTPAAEAPATPAPAPATP